MGHIDPALLTILITAGAGLITALAQLCVALAGYFKSKSDRANIAQQLVENTGITKVILGKQDDIKAAVDAATLKPPETKQ